MKLGDIVEGGECRKGFRKGFCLSFLVLRLWFKPHEYGTGVFLLFWAGSDQTGSCDTTTFNFRKIVVDN